MKHNNDAPCMCGHLYEEHRYALGSHNHECEVEDCDCLCFDIDDEQDADL